MNIRAAILTVLTVAGLTYPPYMVGAHLIPDEILILQFGLGLCVSFLVVIYFGIFIIFTLGLYGKWKRWLDKRG